MVTRSAALAFLVAFAGFEVSIAQTVELVSANPSGISANHDSYDPQMSADGRFIAFGSAATDLVPGDTNGLGDIFVRDRLTGTTVCVSVTSAGVPASGLSFGAAISGNGRFVAFHSDASDLVAGDTNSLRDVFVRDLLTGTTVIASTDSNGNLSNNLSSDAALSHDGRFVVFNSSASNLVPNDTNGLFQDIFLKDLQTGQTTRISVDSSGNESDGTSGLPSISADGTRIVFTSFATNLVPNDTNGITDVFGHDRTTGQTVRLSVGPGGVEANQTSHNPVISADGLVVAFDSNASNLVPGDTNNQADCFAVDLATGAITRVSVDSSGSQGIAFSLEPSLSANGRFVGFSSLASNLVPSDLNTSFDVFVHDRATGETSRLSTDAAGVEGNQRSSHIGLSGDGRQAVFDSVASNLVPLDGNGRRDVFVRDRIELTFHGTPSAGSPAHFEVQGALGESGNTALVVISCTGTSGIPLPGGLVVPITFDACTVLGLKLIGALSGTIDAQGFAATPTVLFPAAPVGLQVYGAAVTVGSSFESVTGPITFVTQ